MEHWHGITWNPALSDPKLGYGGGTPLTLEFIDSGFELPTSIVSASSICLASGVVKLARITILKSGTVLGCWASMWDTKGLDLSLFLKSLWCS